MPAAGQKAVRYSSEGQTIVQASLMHPELAAILKELDISKPTSIAVGCSCVQNLLQIGS